MDDGVVVTGTGTSAGPPDVVRARLAASAVRGTLAEALAAADEAVRRIRETLARDGVAPADAATQGLSVATEQAWSEVTGPRVTGYRAEHLLSVSLRDLAAVGAVLGEALLAGGDDAALHGIEFAVEDPAALRDAARELAWADARDRATSVAGLTGGRLGPVLAVQESPDGGGPAVPFAAARADKAVALDVAPGTVSVSVSLTVRWGLA